MKLEELISKELDENFIITNEYKKLQEKQLYIYEQFTKHLSKEVIMQVEQFDILTMEMYEIRLKQAVNLTIKIFINLFNDLL